MTQEQDTGKAKLKIQGKLKNLFFKIRSFVKKKKKKGLAGSTRGGRALFHAKCAKTNTPKNIF